MLPSLLEIACERVIQIPANKKKELRYEIKRIGRWLWFCILNLQLRNYLQCEFYKQFYKTTGKRTGRWQGSSILWRSERTWRGSTRSRSGSESESDSKMEMAIRLKTKVAILVAQKKLAKPSPSPPRLLAWRKKWVMRSCGRRGTRRRWSSWSRGWRSSAWGGRPRRRRRREIEARF